MSESDKWDVKYQPDADSDPEDPHSDAWEKVTVRVPSEQIDQLDALADRGEYASRSAAIREGISHVLARPRISEGNPEYGGLHPKRLEQIREHAPHPEELVGVVSGDYEHIEEGRWRFSVQMGWYEDVVNALFVEGYRIWRVRSGEGFDQILIDVVEDRWLETTVCINCGERNEPDFTGGTVTCPDCGGEF